MSKFIISLSGEYLDLSGEDLRLSYFCEQCSFSSNNEVY